MTLREFIEQEIEEDHIFDIEDFGTNLVYLEWDDGKEIDPEKFEEYLDCSLNSATIIHDFGANSYLVYYKISINLF